MRDEQAEIENENDVQTSCKEQQEWSGIINHTVDRRIIDIDRCAICML